MTSVVTRVFVLQRAIASGRDFTEMMGGAINIPLKDGKTVSIPVDKITYDPHSNQINISEEMSKTAIWKTLVANESNPNFQSGVRNRCVLSCAFQIFRRSISMCKTSNRSDVLVLLTSFRGQRRLFELDSGFKPRKPPQSFATAGFHGSFGYTS